MNQEIKPENTERNQDYYSGIADEIETILKENEKKYSGSHLEWIIEDLRKGDIDEVRNTCEQQSDKFDSYPNNKIKQILIKKVFDQDEKHPWQLN